MLNNLYSKKEVQNYLKENSIFPNKNRGQNFLCDRNIANNIANIIVNNRSKYCLEIGGGLGSLSEILINIYKENLTIVEYDKALYKHLIKRYSNINIIHKDILTVNIEEIRKESKFDIYGNIPYNIASPIMEWLFCDSYKKWNYAVFMVQSDFANRLIAKPNTENYSALTLFANFMSDIKLEYNVSKEVFYPKPNVESSVISIIPKEIDFEILDIFKSVSKTLFHNRRKNIKNNFINSPYINIEKEKIDEILEKANIDKNDRGESLSLEEVKKLSNVIKEYIIN
ncbi:16S rRNA (adenine(1518)-N(6)/adenine(1519)-N(6))-dimethyltransferase RsmA [Brachyspira sp.]|uniref:16S rRNA (adenine(1518)-N(6)/adenine(1519)-N(6))- dimethyltransferase RsmA n=1 Tax=Brachyspira sp. TaxID=1977261 RepID=UPI003D7CF47C